MTFKPFRVAVCGPSGCGKDTIVPAFATRESISVERISTGDLVKADLKDVIDRFRETGTSAVEDLALSPDELNYVLEPLSPEKLAQCDPLTDTSVEVRSALQRLGKETRCADDEFFYFTRTLELIDRLDLSLSLYVPDGRTPSELVALQDRSFLLGHIDVSEETRLRRLEERDGRRPDPAVSSHSIERGLDEFDNYDFRLNNSGSLDDAVEQLATVLRNVQT